MDKEPTEVRAALSYPEAREFFVRACKEIDTASKEGPLRYLLCTKLPEMFPSKPWWIVEHASRAEANQTYNIDGVERNGFADALIGRTVVEYEKNLNNSALFNEGYIQVENYCAGLLNKGIDYKDIIGVLSDTVRWHAYRIVTDEDLVAFHKGSWGRNDFELDEIDRIDMSGVSDEDLAHFEEFINRYFGRLGSRELTPRSLEMDFGLENQNTIIYQDGIKQIVANAICDRPDYSSMVKGLWKDFVESVGGSSRDFIEDYSHELYVITLAKLIVADAIVGGKPLHRRDDIHDVLTGDFFRARGIENLVEYDYFGWIHEGDSLESLLGFAIMMQRDLTVYDFARLEPTDLFGPLISRLAGFDKRILLGQAPTPPWLAKKMVVSVLDALGGEPPHLLDMCCGSGIFIVQVLSEILGRMGHPDSLDAAQREYLSESIYGFDVDPLAVLLAKANWVLLMRKYITSFPDSVHIPIYHADSLFTRTPVSDCAGYSADSFEIRLFDKELSIPKFLVGKDYRQVFDIVVDTAEVLAESHRDNEPINFEETNKIVSKKCEQFKATLDDEKRSSIDHTFFTLTCALVDLRSRDHNGIWPFVLSNTFKPSLTTGLFNGIVSNPPWLALSRISSNPYRDALVDLSRRYGVMPAGSSFLHVELATIFLIASVDRYLAEEGISACVMPRSVLAGRNEEAFRNRGYLKGSAKVSMRLDGIWDLPKETFKNRACVLLMKKTHDVPPSGCVNGRIYTDASRAEDVTFSLLSNGKASAYSATETDVVEAMDAVRFNQGFDGFPRSAVFFKTNTQPNGKLTLSTIPRTGDAFSFAVSKSKMCRDFDIGTVANIDDSLVFDVITSNLVMPFVSVKRPLKAFIPLRYQAGQGMEEISERDLALLGANNLALKKKVLGCSDSGNPFYDAHGGYLNYLDNRGKLSNTVADTSNWLVLYGAGGKNIAATAICRSELSKPHRLAVDQTLYWHGFATEDEALYYVGLLNSDPLNDAIKAFQPEGNFGQRHIHTLPLCFIPEYESDDPEHQRIVSKTRLVVGSLGRACDEIENLKRIINPSCGALQTRRKRLQSFLKTMSEFGELNEACRAVL